MSRSNGNSPNGDSPNGTLTYAEVRRMARWLGYFTARDLADALRVPPMLGEQFVKALLFHKLATDTGDWLEGPEGHEAIYEMDPLPDGHYPRERRTPPEIVAVREMGGLLLYNLRGVAVRLRAERDMRRSLSTPGARQTHKNREREYERQKRAREQAAEIARKKRIARSQGKVFVEDD